MRHNLIVFLLFLFLTSCKGCRKDNEIDLKREFTPFSLLPDKFSIGLRISLDKVLSLPQVSERLEKLKLNEKLLGGKCKDYDLIHKVSKIEVGTSGDITKGIEYGGVVFGDFDEERVISCREEKIKEEGLRLEDTSYEGIHVYGISGVNYAFAFLNKTIFIFGNRMTVKEIIELYKGIGGVKSLGNNQKFISNYNGLEDKNDIGVIILFNNNLRERLNTGLSKFTDKSKLLSSIDTMQLGFKLEPEIELLVKLIYTNSDAPEELKKIFEELISKHKNELVLMRLAPFVEALSFSVEGIALKIKGRWSRETFGELIKRAFILYEENERLKEEKMEGLLKEDETTTQNLPKSN